jgi:hypothetical protein
MMLRRLALLASVATALQALVYIITTAIPFVGALLSPVMGEAGAAEVAIPAVVLQSVLWPAFFFAFCAELSGSPRRISSRKIALLLALVLAVAYGCDSIVAGGVSLEGLIFPLAWVTFFVTFGLRPDRWYTRKIAIAIAALVAVFGLAQNFRWLQYPLPRLWPLLLGQGVPTLVWVSESLFLWQLSQPQPQIDPSPLNPPDSSQTPTVPA